MWGLLVGMFRKLSLIFANINKKQKESTNKEKNLHAFLFSSFDKISSKNYSVKKKKMSCHV